MKNKEFAKGEGGGGGGGTCINFRKSGKTNTTLTKTIKMEYIHENGTIDIR